MKRKVHAVAEDFLHAHAELHSGLQRLDEVLAPTFGEDLVELRLRLDATQGHITEHFRFEESHGYLDAVRKREPRLERTIQQLAEEHQHLARALEALIERARTATCLDDPFRAAIQDWLEHLRRHEVCENRLVQEAFNVDIRPED